MKIIICTTPIRDTATHTPPYGVTALIQSLRDAGYDPYFYDIDGLRPTFEEAVQFFRDQAPDMIGISAVVSTAYAYTKELSLALKEALPETKIVVGGNLAASAELLLRFCKADVCGIGEGYKIIVNLAKYWESHSTTDDYSQLSQINGLAYLDSSGEVVFTGYEAPVPAADFYPVGWPIIEDYSKIEHHILDPLGEHHYAQDPRTYEPHRLGKKVGFVLSAKGCVAKCTFCHRWDRGFRQRPVDPIIDEIKYQIENYNVGFINFGDESFGSDRKVADELIARIKELDILFQVGAVRCRTVDSDFLARLKDAGCVGVYYGMETSSPRMLQVMEKVTSAEENLNAAIWTHEAGLYTIYQLVLAMPGENHQTVAETGEFIKKVTEFLPAPPHERLSINYIQALPGTPVYEYARDVGLIGNSLEAEEEYLLRISDIDAADDSKFLNFTKYDYLTVQAWRQKIVFDAEMNWYKKRNWKPATNSAAADILRGKASIASNKKDHKKGGYFNLGHVSRHPLFYRFMSYPFAWPLRQMYPVTFALAKDLKHLPKKRSMAIIGEYLFRKVVKRRSFEDYRSLRQVMKDRNTIPLNQSEESMFPLREGR